MTEDWLIIITSIVLAVIAICATYLHIHHRERKLIRERHKLKVYQEFFHAVTDLNTAGPEPEKQHRAKMRLAYILDNMNLVAGPYVLMSTNDFLDFLNECADGDCDVLKELNILNAIVRDMRDELDPKGSKGLDESEFRFRFFIPKNR